MLTTINGSYIEQTDGKISICHCGGMPPMTDEELGLLLICFEKLLGIRIQAINERTSDKVVSILETTTEDGAE